MNETHFKAQSVLSCHVLGVLICGEVPEHPGTLEESKYPRVAGDGAIGYWCPCSCAGVMPTMTLACFLQQEGLKGAVSPGASPSPAVRAGHPLPVPPVALDSLCPPSPNQLSSPLFQGCLRMRRPSTRPSSQGCWEPSSPSPSHPARLQT